MATGRAVRDQTIRLNGLRFHYRDWGDPDAPPLVLLHAGGAHCRTWDAFALAMTDRYRVFALDQRGHGESDWADHYSTAAMAADLAAFVHELGLPLIALVGMAMGGRVAYTYAAHHPERMARLVIVESAPEVLTTGAARLRAALHGPDVFVDPQDAVNAARAANPGADEAALRHLVRFNLMETADGRWTYRFDVALRRGPGPIPQDPDEGWALLRAISCPTLLVRGAESDILSRPVAQRVVLEMPSCCLVELRRVGHMAPLEQPAGFLAAVRPFLLGEG